MANVKDRLSLLDQATPPDVWRFVVGRTTHPLHPAEQDSAKRRVIAATLALAVFAGTGVLVWQAFRPEPRPVVSATPTVRDASELAAALRSAGLGCDKL